MTYKSIDVLVLKMELSVSQDIGRELLALQFNDIYFIVVGKTVETITVVNYPTPVQLYFSVVARQFRHPPNIQCVPYSAP